MDLFRRIFNVNTIILGFAIMSLVMSIHFIIRSYDGFNTLIRHSGAVESKHFSYHYSTHTNSYSHKEEKDSNVIFNFKVVDNAEWYTASRFAIGVDNLVEIGDSIEFYTKKVTSKFGNMVSNGKGSGWNTNSPNEVYHLVSNKYPDPVVDFNEYASDLRTFAWLFLFLPVVFFGWYLYRRSGRKSALVSEYSHFGITTGKA